MSEATPYHHNVFTFTLFLLEGRAGVAWEPSNKMMLFLPPRKIKCLSLHPLISSLNLLFIYPSHLSLSLFGVNGLVQRFSNCGARPLGALQVLGGWGRVVCVTDIFILNDIRAQDKIYILADTLLG
jgi:hypothetical protein